VNSSYGDKSTILGVCDLRREDKDTLILTNKLGHFATFKADIPPQFTLNWENPSEPSSRLLLKLVDGKEYISKPEYIPMI
ncbi:hypothetical protein ACI3QN_13520, partial [Propionibacterium freudenreichii]|uniref:hypothetical protein n=1 Tax=Propionibacterium freudenreichii TaxID=1744 RepID=UPI0038525511